MNKEEIDEARRAMEEAAQPATPDTEAALQELQAMVLARREDPELKKRYEALRDALAAQLEVEGPRYYIDADGMKRYAFSVRPEPIDVDVHAVVSLYEDGQIDIVTLEEIAPRKVDKEAFRRAVAAGRITQAQLLKVATIKKGTAHVKFSEPVDAS